MIITYTQSGHIDAVIDTQHLAITAKYVADGAIVTTENVSATTHYVENGILRARPEMPGAYVDGILTGPEGAAVTVEGPVNGTATLDSDGLELIFEIDGKYTITIRQFPYLDKEYVVEYTEFTG